MGQAAEDMIDGTTCSCCGMFFQDNDPNKCFTHGYPVVCKECWAEMNPAEIEEAKRAGLQRALKEGI